MPASRTLALVEPGAEETLLLEGGLDDVDVIVPRSPDRAVRVEERILPRLKRKLIADLVQLALGKYLVLELNRGNTAE